MNIGAQKMKTFFVQAFGTVNKKWRSLEPNTTIIFAVGF